MAYYVYILTNRRTTVLYTGFTNDLARRIQEHKQKAVSGFTSRYNVDRLVYYEVSDSLEGAKERERSIKGGSRQRKLTLINDFNPNWRDLSLEL